MTDDLRCTYEPTREDGDECEAGDLLMVCATCDALVCHEHGFYSQGADSEFCADDRACDMRSECRQISTYIALHLTGHRPGRSLARALESLV